MVIIALLLKKVRALTARKQAPEAPPQAAEKPKQEPKPLIGITEKAAHTVKRFLEAQGKQDSALRVSVKGGGCSGFQYELDFDEVRQDDHVFEQHGVKVVVDSASVIYVANSVIDYSDDLNESGFVIKNPNAKSKCGCGSSFSM